MDDRLMLTPELERYLGVTEWTICRWIKYKDLPVYKIGGVNRFRKNEIDEWIVRYKKS